MYAIDIIIVLIVSAIMQLAINAVMLFVFWCILKYYEKE